MFFEPITREFFAQTLHFTVTMYFCYDRRESDNWYLLIALDNGTLILKSRRSFDSAVEKNPAIFWFDLKLQKRTLYRLSDRSHNALLVYGLSSDTRNGEFHK